MHLVRRSNEECPMLPSDYYHRRLRFIFALMLTLCLISSALPPQSRAAASTDDGTALVMSGAGRGRKNTGGETYQLPASPLEETPLRTGEINIAGRVIMLPGRLDNHKSDAPRGTVVALRGSRSFILHPIPKLTANHVPDYSAIARGETARSTRTVAANEHAGKPSGTGLLAATRNVFAIAPRVVSLSRKPPIGVFTQGWNKAPQPSDHTAHLAETRTEARVASSNQSALTTGGTDAPHVSAMLPASGNPEASGEAKTEANNSPPPGIGQPSESAATVSESGEKKQGADKSTETPGRTTIKAEGRGAPYINFKDGKELSLQSGTAANQETSASEPSLLASADFDSDGVADLVTADADGTLKFYRGNVDSMFPDSPQAKRHKAEGTFLDSPFYATEKTFPLGLRPDYLVVGDFNGDGRKDVLAAAKGDNGLQLLTGDGRGNFAAPATILLPGKITALGVGEIGRADGQSDVAVAVENGKSSQLVVFEQPEGAFKQKPEVLALPAPAVDIAIGNLDDDYYGDIAVACGDQLTIIHGRGQAYPWDLDPRFGIKRPGAVVATRKMPFGIAALEIGKFSNQRGQNLALLDASGSLYLLEPLRDERKPSNVALPEAAKQQTRSRAFVPSGADAKRFALLAQSGPPNEEAATQRGLTLMDSRLSPDTRQRLLDQKAADEAQKLKAMSKDELAQLLAEKGAQADERRQRTKDAFLRTIAARPSPLSAWKLQMLITDARLASAASSPVAKRLVRLRASNTGRDDLALPDSSARQIHIVAQANTASQMLTSQIVSLDDEAAPLAVLPMQLNADALTDLVVLRSGALSPSVVLTTPTATFTVNTEADGASNCLQTGQPCTLREAIQLANSDGGGAEIDFNIPGSGVHTISPLQELPAITSSVTINGSTQPGFTGTPLIEIKGDQLSGVAADGLKIRASNCFIANLAINEFHAVQDPNTGSLIGGNGMTIESTTLFPNNGNNIITNCSLGTDPSGTLDKGNEATGLNIFDADTNFIAYNLISGNDGAGLSVTAGNDNFIAGNLIGTSRSGMSKLGNTRGVLLTGNNNQIGGDGDFDSNTISGNGKLYPPDVNPAPGQCFGEGMQIVPLISVDTGDLLTNGNTVKGNRIGTSADGLHPLGNCWQGITTTQVVTTTIGSITPAGRNIISDNGYDGIWCNDTFFNGISEGGYCAIIGNNIGTDITGTMAMENDWRNFLGGFFTITGVVNVSNNLSLSNIGAPGGTTPGGACTGFCNLISGNDNLFPPSTGGAVYRDGFGTVGIFNNYVGTTMDGAQALRNFGGIHVETSDTFIGLYDAVQNVNMGNLVSGNGSGINIVSGSGFNFQTHTVEANLVGTDVDGINTIPNGPFTDGAVNIISTFGTSVTIGGINQFSKNYISGNATNGIHVHNIGGDVRIINNYIGLNRNNLPLSNERSGVFLDGYGSTVVGGTDSDEQNVIWNNDLAGVLVHESPGDPPTRGNQIRGNSIKDNGGLGIDLSSDASASGDGVTINDNCDQDSDLGANLLQNFPELIAPVFNSDGTVTVEGILRSSGHQHFTIDFYASTNGDSSGHGEGETSIGSTDVTTDGNGFASFTFTSTSTVSSSAVISSTATDDYGNTSEFSCNAGATCSDSGLSQYRSLKDYLAAPQETCPSALIVTIEGDQSDENPNDGVCDVDTNTTGLQCSLRAALEVVTRAGYVGSHTIKFDISGAGIHTIMPGSALPAITAQVILDGSSQSGYSSAPLIEINGINTGATDGLVFAAGSDGSTVRALAINRFFKAGVKFVSSNNTLTGCYIGILADGITPDPNGRQDTGVHITGSLNRIGGATSLERNVIAANRTTQVLIDTASAMNNTVIGNYIAVIADGEGAAGGTYGVLITHGASGNHIGGSSDQEKNLIGGPGQGIQIEENANGNFVTHNVIRLSMLGVAIRGASNNTIGGGFGEANTIVDNEQGGVFISNIDGDNDASHTQNNKVVNNTIGDFDNDPGTNQATGIVIGVATNNDIGVRNSIGVGYIGNIISGNSNVGIRLLAGAVNNRLEGNVVGLDIGFNTARPNGSGIEIFGSQNKVINNFISGNTENGISIQRENNNTPFPQENTIHTNFIGTNVAGDTAMANGGDGIYVDGMHNQIGDSTLRHRNLISGNGGHGVHIINDSNTVRYNYIGINRAGDAGLGNTGAGIFVDGASDNKLISNVVSANNIGILVSASPEHNTAPTNTIIQGNRIGTNLQGDGALGNLQIGIGVGNKATNTMIGGVDAETGAPAPNLISGNLGIGISVGAAPGEFAILVRPDGTKIQGNLIGTDLSGTQRLGNQRSGIFISIATNTLVGGFGSEIPEARNIISANGLSGVTISGELTHDTRVSGNYIGTASDGVSDLGNGLAGVIIHSGAHDNTVGGTEANAGNKIAFNKKYGVNSA